MAKPRKSESSGNGGTPTSIILSILAAIVIYIAEELKASLSLNESFALRSVLVASIGLGLALCFFWKRLPRSSYRIASAGIFLFGLWMTLLFVTLGPVLLQGELALARFAMFQQFGLITMGLSALILMVGFIAQQKPAPAVLATGAGSLILMVISALGYTQPSKFHDDGEVMVAAAARKTEEPHHGQVAAQHGEGSHDAAPSEASAADHAASDSHHAEPAEHAPAVKEHAAAPTKKNAAEHAKDHSVKHAAAHGSVHAAAAARSDKAHHSPAPKQDSQNSAAAKALEAISAKAKSSVKPEKMKLAAHALIKADEKKESPEGTWGYTGSKSPAMWGELSPSFALCGKGHEQSPIDIGGNWPIYADVKADYRLARAVAVDGGRFIQFNPAPGNSIQIGNRRYQLMNVALHSPAEHSISGQKAAMEIQFFHKDGKGQTAVLSVFVDKGKDDNKAFSELWATLSSDAEAHGKSADGLVNWQGLLPASLKAYRYRGSLTTPPCTENILWNVVTQTLLLSEKQIEAIKARYDGNVRPIQERSN